MNWKEAMKKCREGEAVRHSEMNRRWALVNTPGKGIMQQSDVGGQLDYRPTERDRRREDWEICE